MAEMEQYQCEVCGTKYQVRPGRFCPACGEEKTITFSNFGAIRDALVNVLTTATWEDTKAVCHGTGYDPQTIQEFLKDLDFLVNCAEH